MCLWISGRSLQSVAFVSNEMKTLIHGYVCMRDESTIGTFKMASVWPKQAVHSMDA